jgi:hypothetical protein
MKKCSIVISDAPKVCSSQTEANQNFTLMDTQSNGNRRGASYNDNVPLGHGSGRYETSFATTYQSRPNPNLNNSQLMASQRNMMRSANFHIGFDSSAYTTQTTLKRPQSHSANTGVGPSLAEIRSRQRETHIVLGQVSTENKTQNQAAFRWIQPSRQ